MSPKTPREWALYRAKCTAQIGRDALEGKAKVPDGVTALDWAVFNLLHSVEEIATAMMHTKETSNETNTIRN